MTVGIEFGLSEEQRLIRTNVLKLLERTLPRQELLRLDEAEEFPSLAFDALASAGWTGLPHEKEWGGSDGSLKDLVVLVESIANYSAQVATAFLITVVYAGMQIRYGAQADVKRDILSRLILGQLKLSLCITEPNAGSDVRSISTRASLDGSQFRITGEKTFITLAHLADYFVVAAKTEPNLGHKGISLFLVEAKTPGVTTVPLKGLGRRMVHTNQVFFDEVVVPARHMLGELNAGWEYLMRGLNIERLCISAMACGNMRRIIDIAREHAGNRKAFGRNLGQFQAVAHKLADMEIMFQSSRALTYRAAEMLDAGLSPTLETSAAKVYATESNFKCADLGIQILGGSGYMREHEMQMHFRDSRIGPIGGGTSEILRNVIAKQLGL